MRYSDAVAEVERSLLEWDLKDIRTVMKSEAKVGAFILASCLIDHAANFYSSEKGNRKKYEDFVRTFMKGYDAEDLYQSLRCALVHNYSEGSTKGSRYLLTDGEQAGKHHEPVGNKELLNLEHFVNDVEVAIRRYFERLKVEPELRRRCVGWFKTHPTLSLVKDASVRPGSFMPPPPTGTTTPVIISMQDSKERDA